MDSEEADGADEAPGLKRDIVPGFAKMIREARESRGWNQLKLATAAGLGVSSVWMIERERRAPTLRVAMALCNALGIRVWVNDPTQAVMKTWLPNKDGESAGRTPECAAFARRLVDLMNRRHESSTSLAEKAGVSRQNFCNYVKGRRKPQRETIVRLAAALRVTPEELWPADPGGG